MVGIGQTSCMGFGSIRQEDFLSHPAPSRKRPRIHTPSYGEVSKKNIYNFIKKQRNCKNYIQQMKYIKNVGDVKLKTDC